MRIIDNSTFKSEIQEGVVVVDFFATWCGPCKMLSPILEEIQEEMKEQVKIVKVDIDQSLELAREFQVASVPTMIIFNEGRPVETLIGLMPKDRIKEQLESILQ